MRLTNYIRQAFVASAMNDVPHIDYEEQIRNRVNAMAKEFRKKAGYPESEITQRCDFNSIYVAGVSTVGTYGLLSEERKAIKDDPKILEIAAAYSAQYKARGEMETKLRGVANSVTTRKALIALLPEFEKYLPEDAAAATKATTNLPAISNMVGDFIRAGWPKNKAKTAEATA